MEPGDQLGTLLSCASSGGSSVTEKASLADLDPGSSLRLLLEAAIEQKNLAYCPYSNFHVGAAVLTKDSKVYKGCNVENASYGLTLCAERVAICNAVAHGYTSFSAMAVCCDLKDEFCGPCGACRQTIVEFGSDWTVYMVQPNGDHISLPVRSLLPLGFSPATLKKDRVVST